MNHCSSISDHKQPPVTEDVEEDVDEDVDVVMLKRILNRMLMVVDMTMIGIRLISGL